MYLLNYIDYLLTKYRHRLLSFIARRVWTCRTVVGEARGEEAWQYRPHPGNTRCLRVRMRRSTLRGLPPTRTLRVNTRYKKAYSYCAHIVKTNSRTFAMAAALLPARQRHAVHALYAFCRASDDVLDKAPRGQDVSQSLIQWRARVQSYPNAYDPVLLAWADTQARYQIPHGYVTQLIDGIARDLDQQRYRTFAELTEYCYGVASTVGLMVMHIIGFQSASAVPYAIKLGIALQLTNILRDVGADWQAGRLYLPLDELAQFGVTENDIAQFACGNWDERSHERWRALMRHQIQRTRRLYHEAQPGCTAPSQRAPGHPGGGGSLPGHLRRH